MLTEMTDCSTENISNLDLQIADSEMLPVEDIQSKMDFSVCNIPGNTEDPGTFKVILSLARFMH